MAKTNLPEFGTYSGEIEAFPLNDYKFRNIFYNLFKHLRAKRWRFTGVFSPEIVMGIAVVDTGYIGTSFAYVYDRKTGEIAEYTGKSLLARACNITDNLSKGKAVFNQGKNLISMDWDLKNGIELINIAVQTKSNRIEADIEVLEDVKVNESHQVTFPTFKNKFAFTHKIAGLPVTGSIKCNGKAYNLDKDCSFAAIDHTMGYHDYNWKWLWSSLSGLSEEGRIIGLNLVAPITHKTINENVLWIDGKKFVLGESDFENKKNIMGIWKIKTKNKMVDLTFEPLKVRSEAINIGIIKSKFAQPIGLYNGHVLLPDGEKIYIKDQIGIAEEHFARW